MIGRTNIPCGVSGAVDGVTITDLPTCLKSLSAAATSGSVTLNLTYSSTTYVSGVDVVYKTGSYPTSPTDGTVVNASGAAESVTVSGLTNGTKYFFRVYLFRTMSGVKYFQTDSTNAKVCATPSAISVSGITPAIVAENYLVIDQSGSFAMDIPEGLAVTAYLVGGGTAGDEGYLYGEDDDETPGTGGYGGRSITQSIDKTGLLSCVSVIGSHINYDSVKNLTNTTLTIDGTTYSTSEGTAIAGGAGGSSGSSVYGKYGTNGLLTPHGYIGSSGGGGGIQAGYYTEVGGKGGEGAGDGGYTTFNSSANGADATHYGCGGGGASFAKESTAIYSGGKGKQGCIIIAW